MSLVEPHSLPISFARTISNGSSTLESLQLAQASLPANAATFDARSHSFVSVAPMVAPNMSQGLVQGHGNGVRSFYGVRPQIYTVSGIS